MTNAVIIGTGDQALGLCSFFQNNNGGASGNSLLVTKKNLDPTKEGTFLHDTLVPLANFTEAIGQADVIILAIPASALRVFVPENYPLLKDRILVDATNSSIRGEDLRELVGVTDVRWVKAFNDVGAIDGMVNKVHSKDKVASTMCSPYPDVLRVVKNFAEESLGFDVRVVPYERYADIATNQNSLGKEWLIAGAYMFFWFCVFQFYNIMRHHVHKGYEYYNLPLFSTNKIIAWLTLHGMASAQIPGVLAHFHSMWYRDSLRTKPTWLRICLSVRKHIGLLSLWFMIIHIIGSCMFFNPAYLKKFFVDPKAYSSKMNWMGEVSFSSAVWATGFYIIMGVCSLPNVQSAMTSRQFKFVFGPLAWIALLVATVGHVVPQGCQNWGNKEKWYGNYPQITLTSTLLPMFIMFLKIVQVALWYIQSACTEKPNHETPPPLPQKQQSINSESEATPTDIEAAKGSSGSLDGEVERGSMYFK